MALMPFIPAGYPNLETTQAILPALEAGGANLIEIGIPFSDPVADGPTIQAAFATALAKGLRVADIFKAIAAARAMVSIPLVAMVSYSIVFRYGVDRFLNDAREAGFDGLIVPDLPPPEAQSVCGKVRAAGLDTVLLIAPTTASDRRKEIADLCSGFVYYLSVAGITGARDSLPADLKENVRRIKQISHVPVCVGFGVSRRNTSPSFPPSPTARSWAARSSNKSRCMKRKARRRLRRPCRIIAGCCGAGAAEASAQATETRREKRSQNDEL